LEIIDVGCNLKQFDALTRLTLTPTTYATGTEAVLAWQMKQVAAEE